MSEAPSSSSSSRKPAGGKPFGPHSRALKAGAALDAFIDPDSPEGRYLAEVEAGLIAQLGREPVFSEKLIIRRASRTALRLELFDQKLASGKFTDHDSRTFGGLQNAFRLFLRELKIVGGSAPEPRSRSSSSLAAIAARHREKAAAE
jgi:hypothetical protein